MVFLSFGGRDAKQNQAMSYVATLALIVLFAVVGVSWTLHSLTKRTPNSIDLEPIANKLPIAHHALHLAVKACQGIIDYEDSLLPWKKKLAGANTAPITREAILQKVVRDASMTKGTGYRLVCVVQSNDDGRSKKAKESWAEKCDDYVFIAGKPNIDGIEGSHIADIRPIHGNTQWQKFRMAARHISVTKHLSSSDFFLFAGDFSFVIVENLRRMLQEPYLAYLHDAKSPMLLGHRMVQGESSGAFVSGTAFILNKAGLDIFVAVSDNANCDPNTGSDSVDILLAHCFRYHNIFPFNTQDVFGEDRMHMFDPEGVFRGIRDAAAFIPWYVDYRKKVMPKGLDGVSRYSIHFHGANSDAAVEEFEQHMLKTD